MHIYLQRQVASQHSNAECHRNPFICVDVTVIGELSELLAAGKTVTVKPVKGQQGVYELAYEFDPKRRSQPLDAPRPC